MSTDEPRVVNPAKFSGLVIGEVRTWNGALLTVTLNSEGTVRFGPGFFTWHASVICRDHQGFALPNRGFALDWGNPGWTIDASEWAPVLAALRARGF